jgi:hypothetical protein
MIEKKKNELLKLIKNERMQKNEAEKVSVKFENRKELKLND